jgi:hypothetical protein
MFFDETSYLFVFALLLYYTDEIVPERKYLELYTHETPNRYARKLKNTARKSERKVRLMKSEIGQLSPSID